MPQYYSLSLKYPSLTLFLSLSLFLSFLVKKADKGWRKHSVDKVPVTEAWEPVFKSPNLGRSKHDSAHLWSYCSHSWQRTSLILLFPQCIVHISDAIVPTVRWKTEIRTPKADWPCLCCQLHVGICSAKPCLKQVRRHGLTTEVTLEHASCTHIQILYTYTQW